ncbi:MAG: hypothetical protein HRU38_11365 [Saccharospirillaceae bacterium]|nr:hypothetical protein [Pseudomonadales bacterium]NRB79251.1 hypothetical protein [Saccharospirillaceae bacterium]
MENKIHTYYKKDFRVQMMLIALLQAIGMLLIPIAIVIAFFTWKLALFIGITGALMYWKFGDLNITLPQKWMRFSGDIVVDSTILYANIDSPELAEKFRFVEANFGGLFREKNDIVLGSLEDECRCNVNDFEFEIIHKNAFISYINVKFPNVTHSLFPIWTGALNEQPTTMEKSIWAADIIEQMLSD